MSNKWSRHYPKNKQEDHNTSENRRCKWLSTPAFELKSEPAHKRRRRDYNSCTFEDLSKQSYTHQRHVKYKMTGEDMKIDLEKYRKQPHVWDKVIKITTTKACVNEPN